MACFVPLGTYFPHLCVEFADQASGVTPVSPCQARWGGVCEVRLLAGTRLAYEHLACGLVTGDMNGRVNVSPGFAPVGCSLLALLLGTLIVFDGLSVDSGVASHVVSFRCVMQHQTSSEWYPCQVLRSP